MKVKELLELQSVITKRTIPSDMNKDEVSDHYSTSDDEYIKFNDFQNTLFKNIFSRLLEICSNTSIKYIASYFSDVSLSSIL